MLQLVEEATIEKPKQSAASNISLQAFKLKTKTATLKSKRRHLRCCLSLHRRSNLPGTLCICAGLCQSQAQSSLYANPAHKGVQIAIGVPQIWNILEQLNVLSLQDLDFHNSPSLWLPLAPELPPPEIENLGIPGNAVDKALRVALAF